MFLAGGFSRLGIDARAAGEIAKADSYGAAAASFVFIFTAVFGATWLVGPWIYQAEVFPLAVRARGNAWGVVGWSIGNGWLVSRTPPSRPPKSVPTLILTDPSLPRNVRLHRRENPLRLRRLQHHQYPHGLGSISRKQPADTRRYGSSFRLGLMVGVGCRKNICTS